MAYRFVEPRTRVGEAIEDFGGAKLYFFDFGTSNAKVTHSDFARTVANTDPVVADADGIFPDIFLDIQASVTLKTANDVIVYGPEDIYAPEDGITGLAASAVSVADTAGVFTATNVETVLKEISDNFLKLSRTNTISAGQTFSAGFLQMADFEIRRALMVDYAIKHNAVSSSSGTLTLDLSTGNSFVTTLTENVTTVTLSNPPPTGSYGEITLKVIQDAGGGAYTMTWPASVLWPGGAAPTISVANSAIDEITLRTIDAGTEWRGDYSQAYA